ASIASRAELQQRSRDAEARFAGQDVTRPESWGGYVVIPERMELWLGRPDRLHDRFEYRRSPAAAGTWTIARLAP
ncbi:MAG: pyridoxamine 5'-phosphate oxidase, partial [Chloroflexales bacterium]|nr:pyridoxamine 5'-phosphate oxidase [Chloroflexales bacterium]